MRKLEDLKASILNNDIDKFYIFFGEDYGVRKHYVEKLKTYFEQTDYVDNWVGVKNAIATKSLFSVKKLFIMYDNLEFANESKVNIEMFLNDINGDEYACICIYDNEKFLKSNLFNEFNDYVTEFQAVQDNIGVEFVESELDLLNNEYAEIADNCGNLYNNILLEADKIRNYAEAMGVSQQKAYEDLLMKNQMVEKQVDFISSEFMNAVLTGNFRVLAYWCDMISRYEEYDMFFKQIQNMFYDFIIAGLIKKYGMYDGSSRAFNYGLPWGRAKEIREMELPFEYDYYFDSAFKVSEIDAKVKRGEILKQNIVDYFIVNVI